jgi:hypothetical protein
MDSSLYEQYLLATIVPELDQGRPGWDKPHTLKVVEYVKAIIDSYDDSSNLDRDVLIIAAYLHDYGYMYFLDELLSGGPTTGRAKQEHAEKSAHKWLEIQSHEVFDFLSPRQKARTEHLIRVHDEVCELRDTDELVLMEADTLGALGTTSDIDRTSERYQHYLHATQSKRMSRFVTPYAKTEADRLLSNLLITE